MREWIASKCKACGEVKIDDLAEDARWLKAGELGESATMRGWTALWWEAQSEPLG